MYFRSSASCGLAVTILHHMAVPLRWVLRLWLLLAAPGERSDKCQAKGLENYYPVDYIIDPGSLCKRPEPGAVFFEHIQHEPV